MTDSREMPENMYVARPDGLAPWNCKHYPHDGATHYTHTARLLELVRGKVKAFPDRNSPEIKKLLKTDEKTVVFMEGKIQGYNAALQDVEKLLTQKD